MPPPAEALASRLLLGPALRTQPDRRLVTLVRGGYELAFEEIVRRYRAPLGRYAAAIVGSRSEDVTQEAFSKALLALRRDDAEIELRPWLYRIVRNTALNELRDRPPTADRLAEEIAAGATPAEAIEQRQELRDLINRLRALPERQRAAVVMRELEGLGHDEIAAALGLSGGAARQAIYRARQALRDGLGLLVPLPLVRSLLDHSTGAVEAAAGAAGIGGAGVAVKATAATVLVAGAVGAGIAMDAHSGRGGLGAAGPDAALARPAVPHTSPASPGAGATRTAAASSHAWQVGSDGGGAGPSSPADAGHPPGATDAARRTGSGGGNGPPAPGGGQEGGSRTGGGRPGGGSSHGGNGTGDGSSGGSGGPGEMELQGGSVSGDGTGTDSGSSGSDGSSSGSDHEEVETLDGEHEESHDGGSHQIVETSSSTMEPVDGSRDSQSSEGLSP